MAEEGFAYSDNATFHKEYETNTRGCTQGGIVREMICALAAEVKRAAAISGQLGHRTFDKHLRLWLREWRRSRALRRSRDDGGGGRGREGDSRLFDLRAGTPLRDVVATTVLPLHHARGEPTRVRGYD